jgi:p21-activated kinase 1
VAQNILEEKPMEIPKPPPKPPKPPTLPRKPSQTKVQVRARPKDTPTKNDIIEQLKMLCNTADPKSIYKNFSKIGQGASGAVCTAKDSSTGAMVAIKQMNLDHQPKKELIVNEIVVMSRAKHKNIINYIDSFLVGSDLWVILELTQGCYGVYGRGFAD